MSQQNFQTLLARLLVENEFRQQVREHGPPVLEGDLSEVERRRLLAIAADPGLDVTRTLHDGWRLSKALLMLPMTCRLLGDTRLARELQLFWHDRPPRSLYFHDEAIAFCDHLQRRSGTVLRLRYLDEIVAFERATVQLRRPSATAPPPQQVRFQHDPQRLLTALAAGKRPRSVPEQPCLLIGTRGESADLEWRLAIEANRTVHRGDAGAESVQLTAAVS